MKTSCSAIKSIALIGAFLATVSSTHAQEEKSVEPYIESNWGLAFIVEGAVFPGTSVLMGRRSYFSKNGFTDTQIGLAFPSVLTAKVGVGHTGAKGGHFSAGLRVFPTHVYIQNTLPSNRCNRDVSRRKLQRLERRGKSAADIKCSEWAFSFEISPFLFIGSLPGELETLSFYSMAMLTAGHRWLF